MFKYLSAIELQKSDQKAGPFLPSVFVFIKPVKILPLLKNSNVIKNLQN